MLGSRTPPSRFARYLRVNLAGFARGELTWLTGGFSYVWQQQHGGILSAFFSLPKVATTYDSLILILKIINLVRLFMSLFPGCSWAVVQSLQRSTGVSLLGDLDWYGLNGRGGMRFRGMCLFSLIQGAESWTQDLFQLFSPYFISKALLLCIYVALLFRGLGASFNNTFVRVLMQEKYRKEHFQNCL